MFAKEWGIKEIASEKEKPVFKQSEQKQLMKQLKKIVKKSAPLMWGEHCVECAVPECYHQCSLYEAREDQRCRLFKKGIVKEKAYDGLLGYGVAIIFRPWGKLEAFCNTGQYGMKTIKGLDVCLTALAAGVRNLSRLLPLGRHKWFLTNLYYKCREGLVLLMGKKKQKPDALVISGVNRDLPFKLIVEVKTLENFKFRTSLEIGQGVWAYSIPYDMLHIDSEKRHYLFVYPEGMEKETSLTLTALDLVTYTKEMVVPHNITTLTLEQDCLTFKKIQSQKPAAKVKCLVWDLDQTLWQGILVEDGPSGLVLNEKAVALIKQLDQRGILNAVCSKNDREPAKKKLEELGLWEYFVADRINWEPKSSNIKALARQLNIGIDTFAFIDDSPFERAQVGEALPMVRCYSEKEMELLSELDCFQVPVTKDSQMRRKTYQMLAQRKEEENQWQGDIESFLRSCQMVLTLGRPQPEEIPRCYELLQRTNQLNISGRRLSQEEVEKLIKMPDVDPYVMLCEDKFGSYGIVGFCVVQHESKEAPVITDLVISCRVANKKVEHSLILWLAEVYKEKGCTSLKAIFKPSKKNGLLARVFSELPFEKDEQEEKIIYTMPLNEVMKQDIVSVQKRESKGGYDNEGRGTNSHDEQKEHGLSK